MSRGGARPGAGRPTGSKALHTIEAEALKAYLVERVRAEQKPIIDALIRQARKGDIKAIKEAFDRILGKPTEHVELTGDDGAPIEMSLDLNKATTDELLRLLARKGAANARPRNG